MEGDHVGSFARLLARSTFPVTVVGGATTLAGPRARGFNARTPSFSWNLILSLGDVRLHGEPPSQTKKCLNTQRFGCRLARRCVVGSWRHSSWPCDCSPCSSSCSATVSIQGYKPTIHDRSQIGTKPALTSI